jgi:hypothetical protein
MFGRSYLLKRPANSMFNHDNIMNKYNLAEDLRLECLCASLSAICSALDERHAILFLSFKKDGGDSKISFQMNLRSMGELPPMVDFEEMFIKPSQRLLPPVRR